jgi:hypothetical protein
MENQAVGKILWWSDKNENGIIVDPKGNEFYFDRSVLHLTKRQKIERKAVVTFEHNSRINDCLCACNVRMPTASKKKSIEKDFNQQSIISL